MPRVVHWEMTIENPERAIAFYEKAFGWKVQKWGGDDMEYWLVDTGEGEGIGGAFMKSQDGKMQTINTIDVPSVDEFLAKVTEIGGTVVAQKMPIPTVGWFAYCNDSEGNTFGVIQFDRSVQG